MDIARPQRPTLVDASGRPLAPTRPPEQMSAVKFIRKMAGEAGGINTPQGQALHRLAAHFITLQEELARVSKLKDLSGEHTPERIDAAAEGIYSVAREATINGSKGRVTPDPWPLIVAEKPDEANVYRTMALAALGGPCFYPVATPDDLPPPEPSSETPAL